MSKKFPLPDWEFRIVKNDNTQKCASVPEGAFFVQVSLKKEPQSVFSSPDLIRALTDKKNKMDKEMLRGLLVEYARLSSRVEALNASMLVVDNVSEPKKQPDVAPEIASGKRAAKTTPKVPAVNGVKPVDGGRTKLRPGVIRRRAVPEIDKSAPPPAPATTATRKEALGGAKTGGSARATKKKTEQKVVLASNASEQSASEKGKRKADNDQHAAAASQPLKSSSTHNVAKRVRGVAALRGKKGSAVGRQGKQDGTARPTRTSCYPTVDELLQYVQQSHRSDDTQLCKTAADEYREVTNVHFERVLDSYSQLHFPTWLEHLQLDRNVLLYGAGCKQRLLRRFATDMLQDEDVLELTAPRSAPDGNEELKHTSKKSSTAPGAGEQGVSSTLNTRENVVWSLFETIKRQILGLRRDNAAASDIAQRLAQRGGGLVGHGLAPDGRARRSTASSSSFSTRNANTTSGVMSDDSATTGAAYKREMQEKWYCYQESASVIVEEARLLCDMLLTHYNWRSVAERGNQAAALARAKSSSLNIKSSDVMGFNSDIDGIDDNEDEERLESSKFNRLAGTSVDRACASSTASEDGGGLTNMAYDNSICRLYLLVHNIEDVFPLVQESSSASCPNSEHQIALSILAQCPVVSIVASCSAVMCPVNMQWDQDIHTTFQWVSWHTPTYMHFALLPDILQKCEAAALAGKAGKGRSIMALRYILRSLTRKHCDVLKHVIKMQKRAAASQSSTSQSSGGTVPNSLESGESDIPTGDSLFGSMVTKTVVPNPTDKSVATRGGKQSGNAHIGIKWNELLAVCTTQMITKNDIEMRKLISELIDQRIIKAYGDGQSMMVSLLLSTDEVDGALKYFDGKK